MYIAYEESQKSIELRRWVGAVIIDEKTGQVISTGYNQYPSEEAGSLSSDDRKDEVVHAEVDAILNIINDIIKKENERKYKHLLDNPDLCLYTTTFPCEDCAKCIIKSGIKKVIYIEPYHKSKTEDFYTSFITLKKPEEVEEEGKPLLFLPFEGVGPRLFLSWKAKVEEEKTQNWQEKETRRIKEIKKKQELEKNISYDDSTNVNIDDYLNKQHKDPEKKKQKQSVSNYLSDYGNMWVGTIIVIIFILSILLISVFQDKDEVLRKLAMVEDRQKRDLKTVKETIYEESIEKGRQKERRDIALNMLIKLALILKSSLM